MEGKPKPVGRKNSLANAFYRYINETSRIYDKEFYRKIFELRKDWFFTQKDGSDLKKKKLMEMAINGENKPSRNIPIGRSLNGYIQKGEPTYDESWSQKIRAARPDWFRKPTSTNKQELLRRAVAGEPKPLFTNEQKLASALQRYTKINSPCYDKAFDTDMRKVRPDWFNLSIDLSIQKKAELLGLARKGEKRPFWKSPLGQALTNHTSDTRVYDLNFDIEIRALAPNWFSGSKNKKKKKTKS